MSEESEQVKYGPHRAHNQLKMMAKGQKRSLFGTTKLYSHTQSSTFSPELQTTRTDCQWAGKKQTAEADQPRLLHFGNET